MKYSRCDTPERLVENKCLEWEVKNPKSSEPSAIEVNICLIVKSKEVSF